MSDSPVTFDFDFTPLASFAMYTGEGGRDLFDFDGIIAVQLVKLTPGRGKNAPHHPLVKANAVCLDEDGKGKRCIRDVLAGGNDKNGDSLGRQYAELLVSTGTSEEKIHNNAKNGVKFDINLLNQNILGKTAYFEIERGEYEGQPTTEVKNVVSKERYEQAKSTGAHRRPCKTVVRPAAGVNPGAGTGAFNLGGAPAGAQTQVPNGAGAGAPAGGARPNLPEL